MNADRAVLTAPVNNGTLSLVERTLVWQGAVRKTTATAVDVNDITSIAHSPIGLAGPGAVHIHVAGRVLPITFRYNTYRMGRKSRAALASAVSDFVGLVLAAKKEL